MALTIADILRAVNPNVGLVANPDGSFRIGVEDVNSDEILAAIGDLETDIVLAAGDNNIGNVDILTEPSGSGAYTTPTHTQPSIAAATTAALASNANRLYALLVNDSNEVIYIKLGADAVANQGIRLNASGGSYEISKKLGNLYVGAINGICASGSKALLVTEGE